MGILNITPDSFSDGGRYIDPETAVDHALKMAEQGASIIDIGGESTRPGSEPVSESEEMDRILPVIEQLHKQSKIIISVDTYKNRVAKAALEAGADMINDISGGTFDPEMMPLAAKKKCPYIMMHIKGKPRNMQVNPFYEDVIDEIYVYFEDRIKQAEQAGIDKIILDPGIGFGKRLQDNLQILKNLKDFQWLGKPLLIGVSRKSFIGALLNRETDSRLAGSLASAIVAVQNGAGIIRAHDVRDTVDAIKIYQSIKETNA
ncbi:MAG: dihydropteroate synthase [Calditrichaeota bacterium]|nr:MAG: dihydropteroate synthase [Calditrichota bacterium]